MKTMVVKMRMPAADVPPLLVAWLEEALPYDITVKTGTARGERRVVFTVTGSTQEDIAAKLDALEILIDTHQLKAAIEQ